MSPVGEATRRAMLAVFVGQLNAGIEAELGSSIERPNLDDDLVAKLRRVARSVRTRVAREFGVAEAEIVLPHICRGVDDLVVDLPDEQRRAWSQVVPPQLTTADASRMFDTAAFAAAGITAPGNWSQGTCAECACMAEAEQAETDRADIAEEEVARLERQLLMVGRAFELIKERTSWLAIHTNARDAQNAAVIIEHIVEAAEGDEEAAASIRVLGIEWEDAG